MTETLERPRIVDTWSRCRKLFPALDAVIETIEPDLRDVAVELDGSRWRGRLRDSVDGLVGPVPLLEDCLAPEIESGAACWFAVDEAPADRDFVLASVGRDYLEQLVADAWADPNRRAAIAGRALESLVLKQYAIVGGRATLIAREGLLRVRAQIRGVLRFTLRPPRPVQLDALHRFLAEARGEVVP